MRIGDLRPGVLYAESDSGRPDYANPVVLASTTVVTVANMRGDQTIRASGTLRASTRGRDVTGLIVISVANTAIRDEVTGRVIDYEVDEWVRAGADADHVPDAVRQACAMADQWARSIDALGQWRSAKTADNSGEWPWEAAGSFPCATVATVVTSRKIISTYRDYVTIRDARRCREDEQRRYEQEQRLASQAEHVALSRRAELLDVKIRATGQRGRYELGRSDLERLFDLAEKGARS